MSYKGATVKQGMVTRVFGIVKGKKINQHKPNKLSPSVDPKKQLRGIVSSLRIVFSYVVFQNIISDNVPYHYGS